MNLDEAFSFLLSYVHLFISYISDQKYTKVENMYCEYSIGIFDNLELAQSTCSRLPSCPMLYDSWREGQRFVICGQPPQIKPSEHNSILYAKLSEYSIFILSFTI